MDKFKELLDAYVGACGFIYKLIPGTDKLDESLSSLLLVLLTWVLVPLFAIAVLVAFFWILKWGVITGVILLLLFPAFYIWSQNKKDK